MFRFLNQMAGSFWGWWTNWRRPNLKKRILLEFNDSGSVSMVIWLKGALEIDSATHLPDMETTRRFLSEWDFNPEDDLRTTQLLRRVRSFQTTG